MFVYLEDVVQTFHDNTVKDLVRLQEHAQLSSLVGFISKIKHISCRSTIKDFLVLFIYASKSNDNYCINLNTIIYLREEKSLMIDLQEARMPGVYSC